MNAPYVPIEGEQYQDIANQARLSTLSLLRGMCQINAHKLGTRDGGPVIQGALGGVIEFAVRAEIRPEDLRANFLQTFDTVTPQVIMALKAQKAGATPEGQA